MGRMANRINNKLTIGSWQIADPRVQSVTLRPMVGGFELIFGLRVPTAGEYGERHA